MPRRLVTLRDDALPAPVFARLLRRVRALGQERLRDTYQTTFWFDLGRPASVVEESVLELRRFLPSPRAVAGVEWWLSRMRTTDVRVDFHQDHDIALAERTGRMVSPRVSSVLFLNRVRGGLLAVTREPPCEDNPARAPERFDDVELVKPHPNRLALFPGNLTHGVLDANHDIPRKRLPGGGRIRLAVIVNWWERRPAGVPTYAESGVYRRLRSRY